MIFEIYKKTIMLAKILIGSGILMTATSLAGIVWGIYSSFAALKTNETAGISAVSAGIKFALWSNVLIFAGIIFVVAGAIKLYKDTKNKE